MKIFFYLKVSIISLVLCASLPNLCFGQEVNSKIKILARVSVYGTAGGALLGLATMAFGSSGRAIAQGASLGLYSGLLFGGYIIGSHALRNVNWGPPDADYYPDAGSPYESTSPYQSQYWQPVQEGNVHKMNSEFLRKNEKFAPSYYINVLNLSF